MQGAFAQWRPDMTEVAETPAPRATKTDAVIKLLARAKGATIDEIGAATDWQPHSARAFLTGLRKKGRVLARDKRRNGDTFYRLTA
jgi:hypothetical protein